MCKGGKHMKNRDIFAVLVLILAIFGLFSACEDPNKLDTTLKYTVNFEANGGGFEFV
jgi:hypothetical protein